MNSGTLVTQSTQSMGGAILYDCERKHAGDCHLTLANNKFINNSAESSGGAITWKVSRFIDSGGNMFINNTAPYGPNASSFPGRIEIVFLTNND